MAAKSLTINPYIGALLINRAIIVEEARIDPIVI